MIKRIFSLVLVIVVLALSTITLVSCDKTETITLNVYNWGEYISDGSEGSVNVNAEFEKYYAKQIKDKTGKNVKVKVNYTTYASNEDLYAKLKSGASGYDVIFPSDYMIQRMIAEDMLIKPNYDNIPNFQYISEDFRNLFYDPTNEYSVPYTYGVVGIIYDKNKVDEKDLTGWDLLWNEKYKGQILTFNNLRDLFATAMFKLGIDVNTTKESDWKAAFDALVEQKPLIQSYVMDEVYNKMESGEAAIAPYYAGDFLTMLDSAKEGVDLGFFIPDDTNAFVDAMCIPKGAKNVEVAEAYINFMLSEEIAVANAEYICYASPNTLVRNSEQYKEDMGEEAMELLYPEDFDFKANFEKNGYRNLDQATLKIAGKYWEDLKIEGSVGPVIYIIGAVVVVIIVALIVAYVMKKRRQRNY